MPVLPNFSHKIEAEEALSNLFYQDTVTRYPNNKEIYKKKITDQFTYEHRCENTKFSFKFNLTTHQKRSPIVGFILEVPG